MLEAPELPDLSGEVIQGLVAFKRNSNIQRMEDIDVLVELSSKSFLCEQNTGVTIHLAGLENDFKRAKHAPLTMDEDDFV